MKVRTPLEHARLGPALPILVLAGAVQVYRGYPADIALYFGTAALIVWDDRRWGGVEVSAEPTAATARSKRTIAGLAVAFGLVAGVMPRDSGWLDLILAVPGLAALLVVVRPVRLPDTASGPLAAPACPPASRTSPPAWAVWPALGVGLALIELFSFLSQPDPRTDSYDHPTVSTIVEPWLDDEVLRMLVLAGWVAIGWWLVRRVLAWQARA